MTCNCTYTHAHEHTHVCMLMYTQTHLSCSPAYSYRLHEQTARTLVHTWFTGTGHGVAAQKSENLL